MWIRCEGKWNNLEEVEEGEAVIRIFYMRRKYFSIKGETETKIKSLLQYR